MLKYTLWFDAVTATKCTISHSTILAWCSWMECRSFWLQIEPIYNPSKGTVVDVFGPHTRNAFREAHTRGSHDGGSCGEIHGAVQVYSERGQCGSGGQPPYEGRGGGKIRGLTLLGREAIEILTFLSTRILALLYCGLGLISIYLHNSWADEILWARSKRQPAKHWYMGGRGGSTSCWVFCQWMEGQRLHAVDIEFAEGITLLN